MPDTIVAADPTGSVARLADLVAAGGVAVLSGAGLSTESGIPDYRGPTGRRVRATPMTYQTFTRDAAARQRYWARSHLGWRTVAHAVPNAGHQAVGQLQRAGRLAGVLTQNVDGLHQAGGAHGVLELHGSLHRVTCLDCGELSTRAELHGRLAAANPGFDAPATNAAATNAAAPNAAADAGVTTVRPDGDMDLAAARIAGFRTVACRSCAGTLKPDVVFFGETVPEARVRSGFELVDRARLLLVLGSSLTVLSGRRFVLRAARQGIPVAIVNQGPTRGDRYAAVLVDAPLGTVLPALAAATGQPLV